MVWTYPSNAADKEVNWDGTISAVRFKGDGSQLSGVTGGSGTGVVFPLVIASGGTNQNILASNALLFFDGTSVNSSSSLYYASAAAVRLGIGTGEPVAPIHFQTNNALTTPSLKLENLGAGDTSILLALAAASYSIGLDNSDNDAFKISRGTTLGTTDHLTITGSATIDLEGSTTINISPNGNTTITGPTTGIRLDNPTMIGVGANTKRAMVTVAGTSGGINMSNWSTATLPTAITGTGTLYVSAGALYYLDDVGAVTKVAPSTAGGGSGVVFPLDVASGGTSATSSGAARTMLNVAASFSVYSLISAHEFGGYSPFQAGATTVNDLGICTWTETDNASSYNKGTSGAFFRQVSAATPGSIANNSTGQDSLLHSDFKGVFKWATDNIIASGGVFFVGLSQNNQASSAVSNTSHLGLMFRAASGGNYRWTVGETSNDTNVDSGVPVTNDPLYLTIDHSRSNDSLTFRLRDKNFSELGNYTVSQGMLGGPTNLRFTCGIYSENSGAVAINQYLMHCFYTEVQTP